MTLSPVWVRNGGDGTSAGDWVEFDADLRQDGDGGFVPKAHPARVEVSGAQKAGADGVAVVASLTDPATGITSELTFPGDLPAPEVSGPRARYRSVSPGTDLVVDVTGGGVEQYFVLHELPGEGESLPVGVQASGDDVQVIEPATSGSASEAAALVEVLDGEDEVVATVGRPVMWDATYDAQLAHPVAEDYVSGAEPATWAGSVHALDEADQAGDETGSAGLGEMAQQAGQAISDAFAGGPEPLDLGVAAEVPAQVAVHGAAADIVMDADAGLDAARVAPGNVVLPLVVDPSVSLALPWDTYVQSDSSVEKSMETELRLGTYNGGTVKARTYMNVNTSQVVGKSVRSATLKLWEFHSYSCTAREWVAYSAGLAGASTVWSNQPSINTNYSGSSTQTKGYSDSCGDGWVTMDVTDILRHFSKGTSSERGISLRAANETDSYGWKRFNSTNATSGKPTLTVTLNTAPNTPGSTSIASGQYNWYPSSSATDRELYVKTLTPQINSVVSDPDGDRVRSSVEYHQGTTTVLANGVGSYVASGGTSTYTTGSGILTNGQTYTAKIKAYDGLLSSPTKNLWTFKVDTSKPATPTVTASSYTNGQWRDTKPSSNTFTFTSSSSDVVRFEYSADGGAWTSVTATGSTPTASYAWNPANGAHTLKVRSIDKANWTSAERTFTFGSGGAAITTPTAAGLKSTSTVPVKATAPAPATGSVTAEVLWRVGGGAEPVDFSDTNGSRSGWTAIETAAPVTTSGATVTTSTSLNVAGIAAELGRDRKATRLDVQVCFTYTSPVTTRCSWTATVKSHATATYVPHAFGDDFPTAEAGPGQVALWTGEFALNAQDVAVADLSIDRSYATYDAPAGQSGVFGKGWMADLGDGLAAGMAGYQVSDDTVFDGTISFTDGYTAPLTFAQPGTSRVERKPGVYTAADDDTAAHGLYVLLNAPDAQGRATVLSVTDALGMVTQWHYASGGWRVDSVRDADIPGLTRFDYDAQGRTTRIVAPTPQATDPVTCDAGAEERGCRLLTIAYGTTNSGTDATPGDWSGQVKQVSYTAFDPATSAMQTTVVARYAYNGTGMLVKVTDPRSGLSTTYSYSGTSNAGVPLLTGVTPSGLARWTYQYGSSPVDSKALVTVTRDGATSGAGSVRTNRYVYGINPATTIAGLPAMSAEAVAVWGQQDVPAYGAAVFAQDKSSDVPTSTPSATITDAIWPYADLFYTDDQGRVTNTAQYGAGDWQLTSTAFDDAGRAVRALDTRAIDQIRDAVAAGEEVDPDTYATLTSYNGDITNTASASGPAGSTIPAGSVILPAGSLVTDVWYPASEVTDAATGETSLARAHVTTAYDEGAPNNGVNPATGYGFGLATTIQVLQETVGSDSSEPAKIVSEVRRGYSPIDGGAVLGGTSGWTLRAPTTTTTETGTTDIVTKMRFDALGREVERRQPKSEGTDAGTTLTAYYTADPQSGAFAECGSKPEWDGLVCQNRSGESTATVPATTYQYGYLQEATTTTEVNGPVTRTTTQTHLADGRPDRTTLTVGGLTGSEPVPPTRTLYDDATGLPTAVVSFNSSGVETARISTAYDNWGRPISYTDTDGQVTTTTYDAAGNIAAVGDPVGTTTYTTDNVTEHRGLVVGVNLDGKGQINATYDAAGQVTQQEMPGQVTQTKTYGRAGELASMSYDTTDIDGQPLTLGAWSVGRDLLGRVVTQDTNVGTGADGTQGRSLQYTYDKALRLANVTDTLGACTTTRTYGFDVNGNRTSQDTMAATIDATTGACTNATTTTTSKTWNHDTADRVTNGATINGTASSPYTYDKLGRQTLIPAADTPTGAGAGNLTIGYYDNDAARTLTQGGSSSSFTLDPAGRRSTETRTDTAGTTTIERHYADNSDNPAWAKETDPSGQSTTTWYGSSAIGDLAVTITNDMNASLTLTDPHGDTALTLPVEVTGRTITAAPAYDEYGNQVTTTAFEGTEPLGYGYLGAHERGTTDIGLTLMGVRLYNPTTGLFTSVDPVVGGNTTAYAYPQDPVNQIDLNGMFSWWMTQGLKALGWALAVTANYACRLTGAWWLACVAVASGLSGLAYGLADRGYFSLTWALTVFIVNAIYGILGGPGKEYARRLMKRFILGTRTGQKIWDTAASSRAWRYVKPIFNWIFYG